MVGKSPAILECFRRIELAARTEANILLYGESGVGKELAAQTAHYLSRRAQEPLITVDCTTLPEALFENEFFGHKPGAYTGASGSKPGLFEQARSGTLFLDEVGELPLGAQAKLLRVLETGRFRRLGGNHDVYVDVRIVAATNRNLASMVNEGLFRKDLYYRLSVIDIEIPPLRHRREDIPSLAQFLLQKIGKEWGGSWSLSPEAEERLCEYDYPGNVRELRNILQQAVARAENSAVLLAKHISFPDTSELSVRGSTVGEAVKKTQTPGDLRHQQRMQGLLEGKWDNRRELAKRLGVTERTIYRWLKASELS